MRFFEVDTSVDAIMSAAMVAQTRASSSGKQGKLSMNGFLQMLANAGIMIDYDGFKTIFDGNPKLKNVIAKFNKNEITFVGDSDDDSAGYEEPQTDMPDDERVAKMAKKAMRTREFVEGKMNDLAQEVERVYKTMQRDDKLAQLADEFKDDVSATYDIRRSLNNVLPASMKSAYLDALARDGEMTEDDRMDRFFGTGKYASELDKYFGRNIEPADVIKKIGGSGGGKKKGGKRTDGIPVLDFDYFGQNESMEYNYGASIVNSLERIVDQKQASEVKFFDGKGKVDMYSASMFMNVYNKVNDNNKKKMMKMAETRIGFINLMKKLYAMKTESIEEGHSPHKKGTKKYKAHMAAMHANSAEPKGTMIEGASLEDKIKADIVAGMSTDAIIGKYANKRTTNTDEIRKMIQKIKWNMRKNNESVEERSLTKDEKNKMKSYEKEMSKADFIKRYGKEQGEAIYYGTITNMAKKNA